MRGLRRPIALLALLALAVLLFRPAALSALDLPYGSYHSETVTLVKAEGTHCELLADCETVSIANVGLDAARAFLPVVFAGVVIVFALGRARNVAGWATLVPNPPPLPSLG